MRWRIKVFGGVTPDSDVLQKAPVEIEDAGTVYLGDDGSTGAVVHQSAYVGVLMETRSPGSISMTADDIPRSLHVMENVWHVFFQLGGIEIEGMERRDDGVMVHSRWECEPSGPTAKDEEVLAWLDGQS